MPGRARLGDGAEHLQSEQRSEEGRESGQWTEAKADTSDPNASCGRTGAADALTSIFRSTRDSTTKRAWYAPLSPRRHPHRQAPPREGQDPGAARADARTRPETEDARTVLKADALGARSRAAESDPRQGGSPRSPLHPSPIPGPRFPAGKQLPAARGRRASREGAAAPRESRSPGPVGGGGERVLPVVLHRPGRGPPSTPWLACCDCCAPQPRPRARAFLPGPLPSGGNLQKLSSWVCSVIRVTSVHLLLLLPPCPSLPRKLRLESLHTVC